MKYHSQLMQDKFVDEYLGQKENGFFIDVGAHDGTSASNTLFFEESRNWKGICIEPGPAEYEKLQANRKSHNINACVSDYDGESEYTYIEGPSMMLSGLTETYNRFHEERINREISQLGGRVSKIKLPVFRLQTILDQCGVTHVDYCSIDTEGSEFNIIRSIDFDKVSISVFSIENNYGDLDIQDFLESKGYALLTKIRWDDIFIDTKRKA